MKHSSKSFFAHIEWQLALPLSSLRFVQYALHLEYQNADLFHFSILNHFKSFDERLLVSLAVSVQLPVSPNLQAVKVISFTDNFHFLVFEQNASADLCWTLDLDHLLDILVRMNSGMEISFKRS